MTRAQRIEDKLDRIMKALAIDDEKEIIIRTELGKQIRNRLIQKQNVRTGKVR